jgi:hypothetical protein
MRLVPEPQTSLDEVTVDNAALEQRLEERERAKARAGTARKAYQQADDRAKAIAGELDLGDGDVVRVGRFVLAQRSVPAREVSFGTSPSSRLTIRVAKP